MPTIQRRNRPRFLSSPASRLLLGADITQTQVGEVAGRAQETVSNVLLGIGSREARERVLEAIAVLGGVELAEAVANRIPERPKRSVDFSAVTP